MAMVSMAKTPEDVKKEIGDSYPAPSAMSTTSAYPYGLCISLENDSLKKLGLDGDLPQIGESIQFNAIAKVTSASLNEREKPDGTKEQCCRIELQITDMGVISANTADEEIAKAEARRKRFYGGTDNDADDAA